MIERNFQDITLVDSESLLLNDFSDRFSKNIMPNTNN